MTRQHHRKRPRLTCKVCGKQVAVYANGQPWHHYVPGFGLWTDPPAVCEGSGVSWGRA